MTATLTAVLLLLEAFLVFFATLVAVNVVLWLLVIYEDVHFAESRERIRHEYPTDTGDRAADVDAAPDDHTHIDGPASPAAGPTTNPDPAEPASG